MTNLTENDITKLKSIANLEDYFSINKQIELVQEISSKQNGLLNLFELLIERRFEKKISLSYIDGIIFKYLQCSATNGLQEKVNHYFSEGVVALESSNNINYIPLYNSLISNNFQEANTLTDIYLRDLAKIKNNREWLYFTDIMHLPCKDLNTIDTLWRIYSEGRFGFSIQRKLWLYNNKNWDKLWHKIGWKINNSTIRYPHEFVWDNTAPKGHLPLFNQLRGVQVLAALFKHPVWDNQNGNQNIHTTNY